jgi:hypothetical protein
MDYQQRVVYDDLTRKLYTAAQDFFAEPTPLFVYDEENHEVEVFIWYETVDEERHRLDFTIPFAVYDEDTLGAFIRNAFEGNFV